MAVAFSTGGSGYTRSDFMISDAALPQRVEEAAQADQSDKFSQVLSGIGGKNDAPRDAAKVVEKFTESNGHVDVQKLAKAVADGEVKLEDIPEELLTQELFTELVQLVKVPEKEDGEPTREAAQEAMAELAALFTAQQTVQPENVSDKSAELSELSQPAAEAVQAPGVTQEQPAETQTEAVAEVFPQVAAEEAQPVQTVEQPKSQKPAENAGQTAPVQTEAVPQQAVRAESESAPQQDGDSAQLSGQPQEVKQPVAEEPVRSDITDFTVRTAEPKPQQTENAEPQQEAPVFTAEHTQRSRVVSKSDEFEMIRGNSDSTKADSVQTQPQTAQPEAPVVFARADSGEVQVKPAEVVKQVADRLIERASDLKEGETEYTVTLEPQDLGRITVRMTKTADGAVSVSIAAENSRTLRIIEENGAHIQDSLKQNGVQLENWQTVSESRQDMHAEDYQSSSRNPYQERESNKQEDDSDDKSFAEIIASM
mgnify:CR=1 FL=1